MGRGRRKAIVNKDEVSEDWCFSCKDGGLLLVCEHKNCIKAYHPDCVGKEDSFLDSRARWICELHKCFICKKSSKFHCFCCTNAVCNRCIRTALFVHVRQNQGFCNNCLKLTLLIEENRDVDSDGGKVDFEDRDTCEFLFKDYWNIIKEKEGLTLVDLRTADTNLKNGENYRSQIDSDQDFDTEMDDKEVKAHTFPPRKHNRKLKSKKREFLGWGSRSLVEFLASIGKDASTPLSQYDVHEIIKAYITEMKLTHPEKKKKVLCDPKLQSLFGRKCINRNKIFDLLEPHLAENQDESEDDDLSFSSDGNVDATAKTSKRQKLESTGAKKVEKEKVLESPRSCFASITAQNINLVYLRRSLVEDFLKTPETFNERVVGSFVRIRSDPNDYFRRNTYQLVQVTGTKDSSAGNNSKEIVVQVLGIKKEIPIVKLSNDDFREEEIEDLNQGVKDGMLKKLTIVDLEKKAKTLHEILTKYWIERELVRLERQIDLANEKGWRRELGEYLERRQLLQTPAEQMRLLQEVPKVIAEELELEVVSQDLPEVKKLGENASEIGEPTASEVPHLVVADGKRDVIDGNAAGEISEENREAVNVDVASQHMPNLPVVDGKVNIMDGNVAETIAEENTEAMNVDAAYQDMPNLPVVGKVDVMNGNAAEKIAQENREAMKVDSASEDIPNSVVMDGNAAENFAEGIQADIHATSEAMPDLAREQNGNSTRDAVEENSALKLVDGNEGPAIAASDQNGSVENEGDQRIIKQKDFVAVENEGDQRIIKQKDAETEPIIILDDDDNNHDQTANIILDDDEQTAKEWHYVDPCGVKQGPFSMNQLKRWSDDNYFTSNFTVWKTGQTQKEAILLVDALHQIFTNMG